MKIPGGYILQPRVWDESYAAHFPPVVRELWYWLIRNVSHKDYKTCKRGEGYFSLKDIQDGLSWSVGYRKETYSKPQLTKSLRRLREENMIETTKETRGIRVTIIKYDRYQNPENYESNGEGNTKETRRQRKGHTIDKNYKNVQEGKNEYNALFSDQFLKEHWLEWCRTKKGGDYRNDEARQKALEKLHKLSEGDETKAAEALQEAFDAGWQSYIWVFKRQQNQQRQSKNDHGHNQAGNEESVGNYGARNLERLEGLFTRSAAS